MTERDHPDARREDDSAEPAGTERMDTQPKGPEGADTEGMDIDALPEPTPEQYAERARRADRATKGALTGILALEALVVLLIPRAIAYSIGLGATRTTIVFVVVALLVAAAGLIRRPRGIAIGSGMQVVFFAMGIMFATMFLVGAIFAAIWLRVLMFRQEVIGGKGGIHILAG